MAVGAIGVVAGAGAFVWLDGRRPVDLLAGAEVLAGSHVVQVRGPDEAGARTLVVETSGEATVVDGAGLVRASIVDDEHEARLAAVLSALGEGAPRFLVALGD